MLGALFTVAAGASFALLFSLTELSYEKIGGAGEAMAETLKMTVWQCVVATAVTAAFYVGSIALTFKVSSLFSNVVIRLATPVVPFLSVVFLGEEMNGLKVTALMLSLWGFASYIYQQYLDELKAS
nr:probable purine permease 11 isoform X1 [Ipomoea batatas]GMD09777.1 probable purine permease 11 isoform X1 [Ipomoea batatas]